MNNEVALEKMKHYCAYQERCQQEVHTKLQKLAIFGEDANAIVFSLIEENYLNEERFAQAYASGKFRIKGWGKIKITQGLKQRNISTYCIQKGLQEIEDEEYLNKLKDWITKLQAKTKESNPFKKNGLIAKTLMNKGFESSLIWENLTD